jgi:hypothetical protein
VSWVIALGGLCLATVIVSEVVETARRKCPACRRGWFKRASMKCVQGIVPDGNGGHVRVGGAFSEYRCKYCGAERVQMGAGAYLTREEMAALADDPDGAARFWGQSGPLPKATVVPPREP